MFYSWYLSKLLFKIIYIIISIYSVLITYIQTYISNMPRICRITGLKYALKSHEKKKISGR